MQVNYIIESKYYNGDTYADKFSTLQDVVYALSELARWDNAATPDDERIDLRQITITEEEA